MLIFNGRILSAPLSGVPRYSHEVLGRLQLPHKVAKPRSSRQGSLGHLWEQTVLPAHSRRGLLFSPANTGPLAVRNQVVVIHDASVFDQPEGFTGAFAKWYRWLLPHLGKRCRHVITVSEFSRTRLTHHLGIDSGKISVVYNGISQPQPAHPDTAAECVNRLGVRRPYFLFVGSADPRKNRARLISAFHRAALPEHELVIVGGKVDHLFASDDLGANATRIRQVGRVDDAVLDALYQEADAFVFPSIYEGFGLPPLEAMARGCPVLCSKASCLPEVCGPSFAEGGACLYFDPLDEGSIAHALRHFGTDTTGMKHVMRERGLHQAARYSWAACVSSTENILKRFL